MYGEDGRIILKWMGVEWINLIQDRNKGRTVVNTVINFGVP